MECLVFSVSDVVWYTISSTVKLIVVKEAKRFTKLYNGTLTNDKNKKLTKGVIQSISENIINIESIN